ncbi:MAG: hypothetical protein JSV25_02195 [Spirochaetota bacterium]|nr:MAG: hypothetical protein JSV25_02195 [Spirochaetota bacterium]
MYRELNPFHKGSRIIDNNTHSFSSLFQKSEGKSNPIHMPVIKRGKGPYLYDYDENRYIDFELSGGSLLLGHAPPGITAVMKNWLSRGYAAGYPVVAHQMLSSKISALVLGDEPVEGAWLFYNSSIEASTAVLTILNLFRENPRGLYISPHEDKKSFAPFQYTCIKDIDMKKLKNSIVSDIDFAVVKPGRGYEGSVEDVLHKFKKSEVLLISDETDFASHVHFRQYQSLLDDVDMRVFGSYLSSGISFGSVFVKKKLFFNEAKTMDYSQFKNISTFSYGLPLYIMKAIIKYFGLLQKQGGISGLLDKSRRFYTMLDDKYFDLLDGIVYFKTSKQQRKAYARLRLELLKNCLYFPVFFGDSINISHAHSDAVLKKSAERINILLSDFYRK